ncbi:MAG: LytTR family DNA-binding domain-containing protein [Lachnospiraceae bacterium]
MHLAICDDNVEELVCISSLLEEFRRKHANAVTYETFQSPLELLETMNKRSFDLLILDILMPGVTGMEAAAEIRSYNEKIPIVFLSSSREFALESYRVNAKNYILKPARKEELFPCLEKELANFRKEEAYIILKTKNGLIKLPYSQIVSVEVVNRNVQFTLSNGELRKTYGYLADFEDKLLLNPSFYKPHRSFVVNLNHVCELRKEGFLTTLNTVIPIARDSFVKAKTAYMKYLLLHEEGGPCR